MRGTHDEKTLPSKRSSIYANGGAKKWLERSNSLVFNSYRAFITSIMGIAS